AKIERAVLLAGKEIDVIGHEAAVVMDSGLAASRRPGMTKDGLRGNLQEERLRVDVRMVVRQQIERHRGDLFQQAVEGRRIGGSGNVVAMATPHRGLI